MDVTKRLRLRFRDSNNCTVSFTINPPAEPVNMTDVNELMDYIISSNTFYTYSGGYLVEKLDVSIHTEEVEAIAEFD